MKLPILLAVAMVAMLCMAPSCKTTSLFRAQRKADTNQVALDEESRAMTTGSLDSLQYAPLSPPVELAKKLLEKDQQIEGMPVNRIDVQSVLGSNVVARTTLSNRLVGVEFMLDERSRLQAELRESQAALIEMGKKYEEEKNKSFWRRFRAWGIGSFGLLGFIAFLVFCPALAFPILIGIAKFIVSMVPQLVGAIGIVGKKTVDNIVKGVGEIRKFAKKNPDKQMTAAEWLAFADTEMLKATDGQDRGIIEARRKVLSV